ncbi:MAG TPA: FHA domain-containing protein [Spirochaetia bacterium]|nr:FHA domain-containing protein [Spirochaetia bacterium]
MTLLIRRIIQLALGIAAGLATWPVMESVIRLQVHFPGYLLYTVASGALFGLIFGAFLGSADGIIASRDRRIAAGIAAGGLVGAAGGAFGFLVAQGVLFVVGEYLVGNQFEVRAFAMPIARAVGWAVLGAGVGAASGIRSVSGRKVAIGALGGFIGGLLGGAAVEYGRLLFPDAAVVHLIGLLLLGILIGLAYAFVEKRLSFGVLRMLNGPFKSREFILNQRKITIGSLPRCDIPLPATEKGGPGDSRNGYRGIAGLHCRMLVSGRDLFIQALDGEVRINDQPVKKDPASPLKFDDVVACGSAKLIYRRE